MCCFQYVKFIKFESNSQPSCSTIRTTMKLFSVCQIYKVWKQFTTEKVQDFNRLRCFQYVKFIKFESNSQLWFAAFLSEHCCFQYVKFIKFESNSQLYSFCYKIYVSCFQYVKFIKFESNSQLFIAPFGRKKVVFSMSNL